MDCSIDCPLPVGTILRMNALEPLFPSRHALFWIKTIYAIPLLGKMRGFSSRYSPNPTPRMRQPLRFRQITLTLPQLRFCLLALGDIVEKDGDFSVPWFSDAESINVIPTLQLCGLVFKTYGFTRQGYSAVNFKPVLFVLRSNLAHSPASSILDTCLFLKRRIDFQEAIINRIIVSVKQHFDGAKPFVNRIEQRAVLFFRLAQRFVCCGQLCRSVCDAAFEFLRGAPLLVQLPGFLQGDQGLIRRHP